MNTTIFSRVAVTPAAAEVIDTIRERHGELMFHQSGGCCDGSSPMCFEKGDFRLGSTDVLLGSIHGCSFWMSEDQYEYWKHTHLTVDVTPGRGASFSLEIPMGVRFIIRSRLLDEAEMAHLPPVHVGPI
ncbi:DUF779 domain-containing protein [Tellurirhabdus rosea]|uniref:DUF779 domain-containing protein n=1 Tax=Tellurirhabdus rosea TaxID=2674997 RepID=UPI0022500DE2|nr:DUF779 domain-containing protein [Tellurirhabdus rosea]